MRNESDIQKMFERMDANRRPAPSARSAPASSSDGFDSMFNRMDGQASSQKPDDFNSMFQKMDARKSPVVFNEDADFDAPLPSAVEEFKPLEFTPFHNSDMNIPARLAAGAAEFGGADNPADRSPQTDPDLYGKPVTLSIKSARPSNDDLADALFASISPAALKVNQRYRAETGHNLALPAVDRSNLEQYQDSTGDSYTIPITPTQELYRAINAYGHGGMQELESEISRMQTERQQTAASERTRELSLNAVKERVAQRLGVKPEQFEVDPLRKGLAGTLISGARLMNNVKGVFTDNPGEVARDAEFIQDSARSIPPPRTAAGRVVAGLTEAATSAPFIANPAAPIIGYTENLDLGQEKAIESALPLVVTGGVGRGVGKALEDAAPLTRQVAARGAGGLTNAGLAFATGERDPGRLVASFGVGAAMPIGKGGEGEPEFASTRPLADAPATSSMAREQFTHPDLGNLTATADQSGIPPEMVRVTNEDSDAPFVVRRPQGGVQNDNSNNPNAPASARTPTLAEKISNVANLPRAIQTSLDTHSLFRQAAVSFGSHPIQTLKAYFQSLPSLWNEKYAGRMLNDIQSSPLAPVRQEAGLYLSDYLPKSQPLTAREETLTTNLLGKIPGVRGAQRQFVTFLDKIRADAFDNYVKTNPEATPATLRGIARFINYSTGRGDLGSWGERHALALTNTFYSPRFALSRAQLLTTPFRGTPEARAYATQNLVRYVGTNLAIMGVAKAAGLNVGVNPLSNDFGTISVGNTRVNLWGGMNSLARYTAQLMTGESQSAQAANPRERSRLDTALTFLRTKLNATPSMMVDAATGSDFKGQPTTLGSEARHLFMPISWNDIADAVKADQASGGSGVRGAAVGSLGLLGAGVQTVPQKQGADRLQQEMVKLKADPQNNRLSDDALTHNARVNLAVEPLYRMVDSSDLTPAQKEVAKQYIGSRFVYARMRPGDRRQLESVQRVFNERLNGADVDLQKKITDLRGR